MTDLSDTIAELRQCVELGLPIAHVARSLIPLLQERVDAWDDEVKAISRSICDDIFGTPAQEADDA